MLVKNLQKQIKVIDLFCGIGGMTHGFVKANIPVSAGFDLDNTCKFAYETNNRVAKFYHQDVSELSGGSLCDLYENAKIKILIGCAPCQPFSTYSHQYNKSKNLTTDSKWGLLYHFSRLIKESRPDIISMENVPSVTKHQVFRDFICSLDHLGYKGVYKIVNCRDYGIPQSRKRLILLYAQKEGIELLPTTNHRANYKTVRDTISFLEPIEAGESSKNDVLHSSSLLTPINLERIKQSKPGGTWRDWDSKLIAKCHRKKSGTTYSGVYGRMNWDEPSPTITTQFYGFGNGRFGHPEQNRALSLREGALLQTFPMNYLLHPPTEPVHIHRIGRHIGNAVPVRLGEVIAQSINSFIERQYYASA